jgi:hypothetical protein
VTVKGVRWGILVLVTVLALAAAPASAQDSTCEAPGSLSGVSGSAGDEVALSLPAGCDGASFSVSVQGASAGGTVAGSSASFTMPDLGSEASSATGNISVSPAGGEGWSASFPVDYRGAAASTDPPSDPAPRSDPTSAPVAVVPHSSAPSATQVGIQPARPRGAGEVKGEARHGASRVPKLFRRVGGFVRSILAGRRQRGSRRAARRARHRAARSRDRADRYLDQLGDVPKRPPAQSKKPQGLPGHLPGVKFTVPWRAPLVALVVGLLMVLTLGTLGRQRERRARRERAMEAELQEIVAEERAREPELT